MDYCLKCGKYIMPEVQSRCWLIAIIFIAPIPYTATAKNITTTDTIQTLHMVQAISQMHQDIFANSIY